MSDDFTCITKNIIPTNKRALISKGIRMTSSCAFVSNFTELKCSINPIANNSITHLYPILNDKKT